jgi:polyferredoxin
MIKRWQLVFGALISFVIANTWFEPENAFDKFLNAAAPFVGYTACAMFVFLLIVYPKKKKPKTYFEFENSTLQSSK